MVSFARIFTIDDGVRLSLGTIRNHVVCIKEQIITLCQYFPSFDCIFELGMARALQRVKQWSVFAVATPLLLVPSMLLAPVAKELSRKLLVEWSEVLTKYGLDLTVAVDDRSLLSEQNATIDNTKRGTLYVHLNQQTLMAVMLYNLALPPVKLVVNAEFAALPFIGWTYTAQGAVPIFRQFPESAKKQLEKAVAGLKEGQDFLISIEGQRSKDGKLSPFKKGPVVMAIDAQCDIVPFMTHGEWALWPRGKLSVIPHGKIDVVLYPRITTTGLSYADRDRLVAQLRTLAEREKMVWEVKNEEYLLSIARTVS